MASPSCAKVVIDTDCGIDDALALMLALTEKEKAEVLAITCCFGNTTVDNACSNVMRVLTVCGEKKIPVYRGCAGPLRRPEFPASDTHGSDGLGNCANEFSTGGLSVTETPAPMALLHLVKMYPKQITLIAIGPLTNLAIAHRMDEKFTENLKSLVIMGGNYKGIGNITEVAEFNFFCDPDSANIVLTEAVCPITIVPWETTVEYGISWGTYNEMIAIDSKNGYFVKKITECGKSRRLKNGSPIYNDPDFLAVAAVLYPGCVKSKFLAFAKVECEGKFTSGLMILLKKGTIAATKEIEIITDFDINFLDKLRKSMLSEKN